MRASVLTDIGTLTVEDRPIPNPAPREVLVAVSAVGVRGSEVHYYRHGRIGDYVVRAPLVLGRVADAQDSDADPASLKSIVTP